MINLCDYVNILHGYVEKSKGYRFYCPSHSTRIVESRNAKFLEYDLVNGSGQFRNIVSDNDHTELNLPLQVRNCLLFITPLKFKWV